MADDRARLQCATRGAEIHEEVFHPLVALSGIFGQGLVEDPLEVSAHLRGDVVPERREWGGGIPENRAQRFRSTRSSKGSVPGEHLIEHGAEAEDVAAVIDLRSFGLFGRHAGDGAHDDAGIGLTAKRGGRLGALTSQGLDELGQAEVDDLGVPAFVEHDVVGLEVSVHDALVVGLGEAFGDFDAEIENAGHPEPLFFDDVSELLAADELHDHESDAFRIVDLVDHGDVGMLKGSGGLRLLDEAALALGIGDEVGRQNLESDLAVQLGVHGTVDDAHAAAAQLIEDLVMRKRSPDHVLIFCRASSTRSLSMSPSCQKSRKRW
jgi:hypothetical protein